MRFAVLKSKNKGENMKKSSKISFALAVVLMCAGGGQNAFADEISDSDSSAESTPKLNHTYDLGRIERVVKSQVDSNDSAVFITSEEIEATNSNNIAEALRYQMGVFYHPASGSRGEPNINIRGFGGTQIGFFLDGIPMHSIYDKQTDWGQFSTYGISEMSISKGYTSPQYGMNTMGGAVNMITSKPMDKLEVALKYGFISNNEHQAAVSLGSNLGQYYLQATYSFDTRDSYPLSYKFTPTTNQPNLEAINSYFTNHTLRLKAGFEPNENHEYSLNFIYQKGEKGGSISASPSTQGNRFWQWPHYDKITAYLLGRSNITDMISLNTRLYYDSFYNKLRMLGNYQNGAISNGNKGESIYDDFTIGLIETLGIDFGDNINLKVGVNLRNDNHKNYDPSKVADPETRLSDFSTSIFAEYAQRFSDMFRLMLSASYDRNDMIRAVVDGKKDKTYSLQGGTAQAIVYGDWSENITSWLNVGYKTSLPTLKNRYSTTWGQRVPNPSLQPESAINVEVGTKLDYQTALGTSKAEIAVFYNDLTNMIISVGASGCSSPSNGCTKLENVRNGYSYGVEVGFSQGFWSDKITLGANYTYQQKAAYRNTDKNNKFTGNKFNRILNYPEHIANAMLSLTPFSQWDLIANLTYQSPQWSYNNGYSKNHSVFLVDLKTNLRIVEGLQFSLGVSNVFDALYYYSEGYYMPGRRIFLSLEYKY